MPRLHECPPPEKLALLRGNGLPPEERDEILLHIAGCNDCAMEYSIFASLMEAEEEPEHKNTRSQCPPPEVFALLLEKKLPKAERTEILRHIACCTECAMAYSVAGAMLKGPAARAKPVFFTPRYLSYAAAVALLVGVSLLGGTFYAHRSSMRKYALIAEQRIAPQYGPQVQFAQPEQADRQALPALPVQPAPPEASHNYAPRHSLSRVSHDHARETQKAEQWLRLNETLYLSILNQLPPVVWEHYPANEESLKTLAWIAGLPEKRKKEILALSPEQAMQEREKEEATRPDAK